jgi:hypothetical protein
VKTCKGILGIANEKQKAEIYEHNVYYVAVKSSDTMLTLNSRQVLLDKGPFDRCCEFCNDCPND